jgi:hypothetical protein
MQFVNSCAHLAVSLGQSRPTSSAHLEGEKHRGWRVCLGFIGSRRFRLIDQLDDSSRFAQAC